MSFIVYGLPRSRTFWLSRFLTYGDWTCGHDEIRHLRTIEDAKSWFSQPNTGTVETAAAPWWRTVQTLCPNIKTVVVRRHVPAVVNSLLKTGVTFDVPRLQANMRRLDAKLDQITQRVPNVLSVTFEGLNDEACCAEVFQHCLGLPHDRAWWAATAPLNLQCSLPAILRYYQAHHAQLTKLASICKKQTLTELYARPVSMDGMTLQAEPFDVFYKDAQPLFREHLAIVGEHPEAFSEKNIGLLRTLDQIGGLQIMTARSNGRMFGYLLTIVGPSLESHSGIVGTQATFFASPDAPGVGLKLQRASIEALRTRGASELVLRAGVRGSGPKMSTMFRRIGAVEDGQLFTLKLTG